MYTMGRSVMIANLCIQYPAAEDRGGRPEDTANFVSLCKEIKAAFGGIYGFSITLPASYWYLRHFDVKGMEPYVDWFNVMTYDIHGVWDSENRFTGPYVRPHTNLTEIDEGLSLLWRAGVSAGNVVLGLGWYGRSFKLASPSCTKPGCVFKEGASPGKCSNASGILTSAEIHRVIEDKGLKPTFDEKAAVNWVTFDSDQWVSYDDERTFRLKIDYAEKKCLGGTMVWALDQGASTGETNDEYSGLEGLSKHLSNKGIAMDSAFPNSKGLSLKAVVKEESDRADAEDACYTSFCGEPCVPGYSGVSTMNGQVAGLGEATACKEKNVQTLCCPSGTFTGRCKWYGWRGQGLSCSGTCVDGDVMLAKNTNHIYDYPEQNFFEDQTCNGGYQAYCCRGSRAGPNIKDIKLLEAESFDPGKLHR
ncbi:glycoside hydrolase [Aureobasidium subglaciale]|nr:glycoside hydrolase [Aureobasidium subglaciale]